nr:hypothetical protein [Candidatus Sigynarchaeota archaeon]
MAIVLGLPIPDGYEIIFLLTLVLILVKLVMAIYLGVRLRKSKKEENPVAPIFMGSIMLVMILWSISRIFFAIFDFFLTKFDTNTYALFPNVWFWKFGALFASIGVILVLWIIDRKILGNKFKGIFAIIMLASMILETLWPVSTFADFQAASTVGLVGSLMALFIPILFFYIGIKTPGLRKTAFLLAVGIIIYTLGGGLVSAAIIDIFTGAGLTPDMVYLISTSMKIAGLLMITIGTTRFRF